MEQRNLIGHILMDLGYLKVEQVNEARRTQMAYPELKLGEILIEMKFLTPEQLEKGLKVQELERVEESSPVKEERDPPPISPA